MKSVASPKYLSTFRPVRVNVATSRKGCSVALNDVVERVLAAKTAEDVVGPADEGRRKRERDLFRLLHPDAGGNADAFAHLQQLLAAEARREAGIFEVTTRTRTYTVSGLAYRGRVANLYNCTFVDGGTRDALLKLPRSPVDNDLVQADASALRRIHDSGKRRAGYFPHFVEAFRHRDAATRIDRRAVVMEKLEGFYSLAEVKAAYPAGLDGRDLAWMWRRALAGISLVHELGLVHGAIVPEHILIHPAEHGLVFVDFTASVEIDGTVKALGGGREFYPPEVLNKEPVSPATDIYMLSQVMRWMLRADQPRQFFAFIKGCTDTRPKVRPQDAQQLRGEFDELLERLYGPRKFRVFTMPTNNKEDR